MDPASTSDSGGIAARRGFRIQDHVAARIALEMLQDPAVIQLECETGDDIVLRRNEDGADINEYVQVKTTEKDGKWTITELATRDANRKGSSVCEKSLLCDKHGAMAWFRFVTTRAVSAKLIPFTRARGKRSTDTKHAALVTSFSKKYKDVKSASGHTLGDWSRELLWEVEGDERSLVARNTNALLRLAGGNGLHPGWQAINETYERLVNKVRAMGDAPSNAPEDKLWSRDECAAWWQAELTAMRVAAGKAVKVYQVDTTPFFAGLWTVEDSAIKRALYAYDVEYDDDIWRKTELIDHLLDWLPEIALPAQTLAGYDHLSARRLPGDALKELDRRGTTDIPQLVASLILHAILRHHFDAEPIACRIFLAIDGVMRSTSAHIVPLSGGDEIWLGRSRLVTASTHHAVITEVFAELRTALTRDVLLEERDIIIQLRQPRHLRANSLDEILTSTSKTSDLRKVIRLPILVAYDSATLQAGFDAEYVGRLQQEVEDEYERIKSEIGDELKDVEVSLFLVPVECAATLAVDFERRLRGR